MSFNAEKLQKFKEKHAAAQTGGKGSVRRKKKVVRKSAAQDDKRLKATLQRLNCRDIPGIEEVNLFKEDGSVIHFTNPKGARGGGDASERCLRGAGSRARRSASLDRRQHVRGERQLGGQE
jgi:hypothetical protein